MLGRTLQTISRRSERDNYAAFGARPLKRVLQRQVANRLAEQIQAGFVSEGDAVVVDAAPGGGVTLETIPAGEPLPEPSQASTETPDDGMETATAPFATAGDA